MGTNSPSDAPQNTSTPSLFFRFLKCDWLYIFCSFTKHNISTETPEACPENLSRNSLISTVYKQHITRFKIIEPYRRLKNALKNMQEEYLQSRDNNVYARYNQLKCMIYDVILLEKQYWHVVQIPAQKSLEPSNSYVLRIINLLDDKVGQEPANKSNGIASFFGPKTITVAASTKYQNLLEQIRVMSTEDLRKECEHLYIELYKLIRKYLGLQQLVQELTKSFHDTRYYPPMVRYPLLKAMIKRVLRDPAFSEVCHEIDK